MLTSTQLLSSGSAESCVCLCVCVLGGGQEAVGGPMTYQSSVCDCFSVDRG
ncbi:hypothetical protein EXN66_Car001152 [Channa argus]|uniref:Uncharacterized protein n=1 Tax=Channa argus TaxID=215402 RepID=A0A6G1R0B0_CHAAH|nr:hypothetical protein EXN66_Car001152 [Channa argus]